MGLLDTIRGIPTTVKKKVKEHDIKVKKDATALRKKRNKYLPIIRNVAHEYGADVEPLEKNALVTKKVRGEMRRAYVAYGVDTESIRAKLDKAFLTRSVAEKMKSATETVAKTAKTMRTMRDDLQKSGLGGGGMWGDPRDLYK